MRKFSNVSRCCYSPIRKKSSRIDWHKQMLYEKLYPGKIFYKEDHVLIRSSSGRAFKKLTSEQISQLHKDIQVGDMILLQDTVDHDFTRFINDILVVEHIDDEGRIHGRFRMTKEYINLLPELDVMVNLTQGNKTIRMIKVIDDRCMER